MAKCGIPKEDYEVFVKAIGDANDAKALAEGIIKQKDVQGVASQSTITKFVLADALFGLKNALESLLKSSEKVITSCDVVPLVETDKFIQKSELKDMLTQLLPEVINASVLKKYDVQDPALPTIVEEQVEEQPVMKEKHVIVIHGENDQDNTFSGFGENKWNEVVRKNVSTKLKGISVEKSLRTKDGKGCIFLPDAQTMVKVKTVLEKEYNVEASSKKAQKNLLYPKMRIYDIDTAMYPKGSDTALYNDILLKNPLIKDALAANSESFLEVVLIQESSKFAILKMCSDIRSLIVKNGYKLFLDLTAHTVKDHLHLMQCYACQKFGHKAGSSACSKKTACLYCASPDHLSKECPVKNDKDQHTCVNCLSHNLYKANAKGHTCTDYACPLVQKELHSIVNRTHGVSCKDFPQLLKQRSLR